MNVQVSEAQAAGQGDVAPGHDTDDGASLGARFRTYLIGFGLAAGLTAVSFWAAQTQLIYPPGIAPALVTLAIAQMGIHLIFFLHITTAPDNTNNVLALAFGILIVAFVVFGSLWIMDHLNHMMPTMEQMMRMQR